MSLNISECYCWWTKSCTTKDDDYLIFYRVLTIPGGAGFCPSTVSMKVCSGPASFQWSRSWGSFHNRLLPARFETGRKVVVVVSWWGLPLWHKKCSQLFFLQYENGFEEGNVILKSSIYIYILCIYIYICISFTWFHPASLYEKHLTVNHRLLKSLIDGNGSQHGDLKATQAKRIV